MPNGFIRSVTVVTAVASLAIAARAQEVDGLPVATKTAPAWPLNRPSERAIFCGAPGTETSAMYASALAREIRALVSQGKSTQQALATITARARCNEVFLNGAAS